MRTVRGTVRLPADAPAAVAGLLLVEVRDVSVADAPSVVVATWRTTDVAVGPGSVLPFAIETPETEPGRTLALRAHLSLDGKETVARGDAISTSHVEVPSSGDADGVDVPVRVV
jgi:putative lipoprotein